MTAYLDIVLVAVCVVCATVLAALKAIDTTTTASLFGAAIGYAGRSGLAAARNASKAA